jgi:hypothetical protein
MHFIFVSVQTQNVGFGLPSSFSWLDKYRSQTVTAGFSTSPKEDNPFAADVFDPLKHMNIENNTSKRSPKNSDTSKRSPKNSDTSKRSPKNSVTSKRSPRNSGKFI